MQRRFVEARVARLATVGPASQPHVVPVCFFATPEWLVTAVDDKPKTTTNLRRLEHVRANPAVSLLVDHYEEDWSLLWWVRADGVARVVEERDELDRFLEPLLEKYQGHYGLGPLQGPAIVVDLQHWAGWIASASA